MSPIRPIPLKSDAPPKPQNRSRKRFRRPRGCQSVKACQFTGTGPCPSPGCNVVRGRQGNGPVANEAAIREYLDPATDIKLLAASMGPSNYILRNIR